MTISTYLADVWSATDFGDPALSGYARDQLRRDTRNGVQTMATLFLVVLPVVALLVYSNNLGMPYLQTIGIMFVLSLHILLSAAFVKDVRGLQTLGIVFLVISALALTFLAHRAGDLNIGIMAAVIMVFVAVPLVPWALREATIVVSLTYLLLTASLFSVPGRFAPGALLVLQTLLIGSAVVSIVVAGRNTYVRKQDVRARFALETARSDMKLLSMKDDLTGAWNRRYLDENFADFARNCLAQRKAIHVAVLDIDNFKGINDEFGHHFGDRILISVADIFSGLIGENGRLIRLGGDEFLIGYAGNDLDGLIENAIVRLQSRLADLGLASDPVITLSAGIVSSTPDQLADLESLYKSADSALYRAKRNRPARERSVVPLARTGSWKITGSRTA